MWSSVDSYVQRAQGPILITLRACGGLCWWDREVYSEPSQTSKTERFAKTLNGFQPLFSFAKRSISYVRLGSEYASEIPWQWSWLSCWNWPYFAVQLCLKTKQNIIFIYGILNFGIWPTFSRLRDTNYINNHTVYCNQPCTVIL